MTLKKKHIAYWRIGAEEDWQVAKDLISMGRTRHGLFFAYLALEKMLKAHICQAAHDLPARKLDAGVDVIRVGDPGACHSAHWRVMG